jgi:hypothetical protein
VTSAALASMLSPKTAIDVNAKKTKKQQMMGSRASSAPQKVSPFK